MKLLILLGTILSFYAEAMDLHRLTLYQPAIQNIRGKIFNHEAYLLAYPDIKKSHASLFSAEKGREPAYQHYLTVGEKQNLLEKVPYQDALRSICEAFYHVGQPRSSMS